MAARTHAQRQARQLIADLSTDVEASARQTLVVLGESFGAQAVTLNFQSESEGEMEINVEPLFDQAA